MDIILKEKWRG